MRSLRSHWLKLCETDIGKLEQEYCLAGQKFWLEWSSKKTSALNMVSSACTDLAVYARVCDYELGPVDQSYQKSDIASWVVCEFRDVNVVAASDLWQAHATPCCADRVKLWLASYHDIILWLRDESLRKILTTFFYLLADTVRRNGYAQFVYKGSQLWILAQCTFFLNSFMAPFTGFKKKIAICRMLEGRWQLESPSKLFQSTGMKYLYCCQLKGR